MATSVVFVFGALSLTGAAAAPARARPPASCAVEIGPKRAGALLRECREAALAGAARCRADRPCEALREMIRESCREAGADGPPVCLDGPEAEDDDEDE